MPGHPRTAAGRIDGVPGGARRQIRGRIGEWLGGGAGDRRVGNWGVGYRGDGAPCGCRRRRRGRQSAAGRSLLGGGDGGLGGVRVGYGHLRVDEPQRRRCRRARRPRRRLSAARWPPRGDRPCPREAGEAINGKRRAASSAASPGNPGSAGSGSAPGASDSWLWSADRAGSGRIRYR